MRDIHLRIEDQVPMEEVQVWGAELAIEDVGKQLQDEEKVQQTDEERADEEEDWPKPDEEVGKKRKELQQEWAARGWRDRTAVGSTPLAVGSTPVREWKGKEGGPPGGSTDGVAWGSCRAEATQEEAQ